MLRTFMLIVFTVHCVYVNKSEKLVDKGILQTNNWTDICEGTSVGATKTSEFRIGIRMEFNASVFWHE